MRRCSLRQVDTQVSVRCYGSLSEVLTLHAHAQVGGEVTLAVIAITLTPIIYEARKSLGGETTDKKDGFRPIPFL